MSQSFRGRKGGSRFTTGGTAPGAVTKQDSGRAVYQCLVPVVISTVHMRGRGPVATGWQFELLSWCGFAWSVVQGSDTNLAIKEPWPAQVRYLDLALLCQQQPRQQLGSGFTARDGAFHCLTLRFHSSRVWWLLCSVEITISAEIRRLSPAWLPLSSRLKYWK